MKHVTQITNSHCGPAVIQMLLSHLDISVTQTALTKAAKAEKTIKTHGMRVSQMAEAAYKMAPDTKFWYKTKGTIGNLDTLTRDYHYPVGVEWQGLFDTKEVLDPKAESRSHDRGHYSVTVSIDRRNKKIVMADPYRSFSSKKRRVPLPLFRKCWWDVNQVITKTGKRRNVKDERMLFIITPKDMSFPAHLGLSIYPSK